MNHDKQKNIEDIYPLSPMQQGMLFHTIYNPESGAYFEQFACKLKGDIDKVAFEKAWHIVVQRHAPLRTSFVWKKINKMLQVVHTKVDLPLTEQDWRNMDREEQENKFRALMKADQEKGFNLSKAPLMRFHLIRLGNDTYQFLWSFHHLLTDGWSIPIILKEVFTAYDMTVQGYPVQLPAVRPYRNYINWLQQQDMEKARAFWKSQLLDFSQPTPLVRDKTSWKLTDKQPAYKKLKLELTAGTSEQLQLLARQNQLTLNTLVQGAWALALSRYSGENDVLFGATVSGRPPELEDVESMVGLFINTLPVRVQIQPGQNTVEWLKTIQARAVAMREFEYSPLVDIQGWSAVPRNLPLFNSIVVFENYPLDSTIRDQHLSFEVFDFRSSEQTNYPITLVAGAPKSLVLEIAFDGRTFEDEIIRNTLHHLANILTSFAENPRQKLSQIRILLPEEEKQIIHEWNQTTGDFPGHLCVHQLFEQQVDQRPDTIALQFNQDVMTYRELNDNANRLAHFLRKRGIGPETVVAMYLERSMAMIVSLMAIMKAGGAYVPIDPTYPTERVTYILQDSGAKLVITQNGLAENVRLFGEANINLDLEREAISKESSENPVNLSDPENLAYIIYTSGSTGKPKGTLLQHYGAINTSVALGRHFKLLPGKSILQFASIGFDASVAEIFSALLNGSALHLASRETILSTTDLTQLLREQKTSTAIITPSVLALLDNEDLPDLEVIGSAGESCSQEVIERWAPGRDFVNGYGPTEVTVSGSLYHHDNRLPTPIIVPIGRPMENVHFYVLNEALQPQPVGVPGELHINSAGLARGYLNRPDLTAEKFIPDPFTDVPGARMYKTGDLVRYLTDGQLEFIDRIDHQVKIRGFRIELGEIEAVMISHPEIRDAVVVAHEETPGNKILVGYYVSANENGTERSILQEFLSKQLPDHMIPAVFIHMKTLPLTTSGKVDLRALPAPEASDREETHSYIAPRNQVEEILAGIWKSILKLERISINANFFNLGGHSLLATQLISRIRDAFEVELPLQTFFEAPTIKALALEIEKIQLKDKAPVAPPIEPVERDGNLPLSFAQQRLWFLDQLAPGGSFYNIPSAIRLSGKLNIKVLERCINEIIRRHESLRTTFSNVKGDPVQVIKPEMVIKIQVQDLSGLPQKEREAEARQVAITEAALSFDLETGPLFRTRLIQLDADEYLMLFTLHHIISDGWSMGVLVQEVAALYDAFISDQVSPLPDLPVQYADFAVWQRNWLQGEVLEKQIEFWKNEIGLNPPVMDLPIDYPRPAMQTFRGKTLEAVLPKTLSDKLVDLSQKEGVTLFMTLLAGFQSLMHRYSGQDTILVGSPIANRTYSDTEQMIGFFVNTLVLKADFVGNPDFLTLLKQIRERTLKAYAHQDLPFEQLVEVLQPERDMSHSPLFQVAFILQNVPLDKIELQEVSIHPFDAENQTAKFDLSLYCVETEEGIKLSIEYNTDLFMASTIERLKNHYQNLLDQMVRHPKQKIANLSYLSDEERELMQVQWNATESVFPSDQTVHQLFESWAQKNPANTALVFGRDQMTYDTLNKRANQLAGYLRKNGVSAETLVGISMPRSLDVPLSILGILKAGGAFLPIDPIYPPDRIQYMIQDSGISVLLTQEAISRQFKSDNLKIISLDRDREKIDAESQENLTYNTLPAHLAYIIYTSGSTGQPKGTMLQHQGLCNLSRAQQKAFNIISESRILQFAPMSFDASVWETVMALLNGASLVLTDQESLTSGQGLLNTLKENQVTTVTLPPSVLAVMPEDELSHLQTIVTAGEKCTTDLVRRWGNGRQFVNAYGPTETTVCASMYVTNSELMIEPPIGKPIDNFQLYVLDKNWQPVSIGIPGELCVGGVGLARGYLKRPELTAEKFIPDPFNRRRGSRLYRTGDLVRYMPDGNLEFLGRIDFQVKLRGFRIELGEIEAVLTSHDSIRDAAVLAREDTPGDQRLVAYFVSEDNQTIASADLRTYLKQQLPEYMVPSIFVALKTMPLTPSGKVDRKALPRPDQTRRDLESEYVAPRNENEEKLTAMVGELLNLKKVGIYDNFFELGGHSLLATKFISRIRETFEVELPLRKVFENPTVAEMAEIISHSEISEAEKIQYIERGTQDIDQLLKELDGLSEEEVEALLKKEKNKQDRNKKNNE